MHIRVLLSKYRSYTPCPACGGARLKPEALLWRLGTKEDADAVLAPAKRFMPVGAQWSREQLEAMPGLTVHDLMLLPIDRIRGFFDRLSLPSGLLDEALKLLLDEVRTRSALVPALRISVKRGEGFCYRHFRTAGSLPWAASRRARSSKRCPA